MTNAEIAIRDIETKIYIIRGVKVLFDSDLAELYGVETKALNRAVRRNLERFPQDFMFQLTPVEVHELRIHFPRELMEAAQRGGRRTLPFAFTQEGVAMLSGVLHSERAILVNVAIMRTFVKLRALVGDEGSLARKLDALEQKYDRQFKVVFDAIRGLMSNQAIPRKRIIGLDPESVAVPEKVDAE